MVQGDISEYYQMMFGVVYLYFDSLEFLFVYLQVIVDWEEDIEYMYYYLGLVYWKLGNFEWSQVYFE